uniref:Calx-beta domain-containing protein n=2 Tax=Plectus sambesii TaxID=2011161 RepID=A0A914XPX3_9BILA
MIVNDMSLSNNSFYYRCSNVGLFLPLINESSWQDGWRAVLYFIGLLYCFFGLAVASDALMSAIERITSQTVSAKVNNKPRGSAESIDEDVERTTGSLESRLWNPTVARLTLIALASSTPEIFLTFIESAEQEFRAGSLGPSTIVGSAAFNAFLVTAVCLLAVPSAQTRRISQGSVLVTTTVVNVFAFGWLLVILKLITPDAIEIWEALLTMLFMIVFVPLAYAADKHFCMGKVSVPIIVGKWKRKGVETLAQNKEGHPMDAAVEDQLKDDHLAQDSQTKQTIVSPDENRVERRASSSRLPTAADRMNGLRWQAMNRECAKRFPNADAATLSHATAQKLDASRPHTTTHYRILATRALAAGKRHLTTMSQDSKVEPVRLVKEAGNTATEAVKLSVIEFAANKYAVVEKDTNIRLKVVRSGRLNKRVLFKYETFDGSAKRGKDYVSRTETLVFNPGENEKFISVEVLPDHEKEADEMFFVKLGLEDFADGRTAIGPNNIAQIVIMDTERDTKLQFGQASFVVKESVGIIRVPVVRRGNTKMKASVSWTTVADTAKDGRDY